MSCMLTETGNALTEHYESDEIGSCSCGVAVRKINGSNITSRIDGVRYARPDDTQGWSLFRCRECHAVISESYMPPVAMSLSDDGERCDGAWRPECEECARLTAPRPEHVLMMNAPELTEGNCPERIEK